MKTETLTLPSYKNAFKCSKCPQNNGPTGCPVWLETTVTEINTGEHKLQRGCGFQMVPSFLVDLAKVEDTRAGEISSMKEAVVDQVTKASLLYMDRNNDKKTLPSQD